jgi:hypothetical protein
LLARHASASSAALRVRSSVVAPLMLTLRCASSRWKARAAGPAAARSCCSDCATAGVM